MSLKTLEIMDLHCSRSLAAYIICCVVKPPPIALFVSSIYLILGLPLPLRPSILPVNIRFSRSSRLTTCPRNLIRRLLMTASSSLLLPISSRMLSFVFLSVQLIFSIRRQHHISIASNLFLVS